MLGTFLDQLFARYHEDRFLVSDPLEFVHQYPDPWDQEVVAVVAALLAYGNVTQIRRSVSDLLLRMESAAGSPAAFVRLSGTASGRKKAQAALDGFVHRFNVGEDLYELSWLIFRSWEEHGSLGAHFLEGLSPEDAHIGPALDRLIAGWRRWREEGQARKLLPRTRRRDSFQYLLTAPADGSCCKRWCMLLRWMGRKDRLDVGLWTFGSPLEKTFPPGRALRADQLIMPLDTHTGRISQYLGLTSRKSLNWLAAVEVTQSLAKFSPQDPTRYDFALARLGILDLCQKAYRMEICSHCELQPACRFAQSKGLS